MENLFAYRLAARDGPLVFHLGERGVGLEETSVVLRSDTLFSALCIAWQSLGRDLAAYLAAFPQAAPPWDAGPALPPAAPPFWLSSAFPYCGETYFMPNPMLPRKRKNDVNFAEGTGKALKKIRYVSKALFEKQIQGQPTEADLFAVEAGEISRLRPEVLAQSGQVLVSEAEAAADLPNDRVIWSEETQPRVTVGRADGSSTVFGSGRVRFAAGCGLYFLVRYADLAWKERVEEALRALSFEGIGGERSVGNGQFRLETRADFSLAEPPAPDGYVTLALVWPGKTEARAGLLEQARYGLVTRRGWITSQSGMGLRRPNLRMLAEGSVFKKMPAGSLVNLKPDVSPALGHDVWRCGLGFPVACRLLEEENDGC